MTPVARCALRRLACAAVLSAGLPLTAGAAPVDDYVAARDKAISAAVAAAKAGKSSDEAVVKREEAALADLKKRMVAVIGPQKFKGLGAPEFTLQVLLYGDSDPTQQLDGLVFADEDYSRRIVVAPEPVFQSWLAARAKDEGAPAALGGGVKAAVGTAEFYTSSLGFDGGYYQPYVELPIAAAPGETAFAVLGLHLEEPSGNSAPDEIAIVRIADGKAMVGITTTKLKPQPIPACDAIWKPYKAKADALQKVVEKENKPEDPRWDEIIKISSDGSDAYRACFAKEAPKLPFFADATKTADGFLKQARGQ